MVYVLCVLASMHALLPFMYSLLACLLACVCMCLWAHECVFLCLYDGRELWVQLRVREGYINTVVLFEDREDAERYAGLLEAQDFPAPQVLSLSPSLPLPLSPSPPLLLRACNGA